MAQIESTAVKEGDVVIRHYSDKPTPHALTLILKDGDPKGISLGIALGRQKAIELAEARRGEGGRMFFVEDGVWSQLEE